MKAEEILIESAKKHMVYFNLDKFKRTHNSLYKTFIYVFKSQSKEIERLKRHLSIYKETYGELAKENIQLTERIKELEDCLSDFYEEVSIEKEIPLLITTHQKIEKLLNQNPKG
jgi:predicted RNase H-like nuclease (RuvC/YqgF family)